MPGIMADNDIQGQFEGLLTLFLSETWRELWAGLGFTVETFESLELPRNAPDLVLWQTCQARQVVLITGNRNREGADSLEAAIQTLNQAGSLPVITLADPERCRTSRAYAERVAERLLEYLLHLDDYLGAGRLYVP
jgi:hypothetical protein